MHTRSEHLETFINLTTAPSHMVSAGGVSFTVPAGSPQEEASVWKWKNMKFVWEDIELAISLM